MSWVIRINTKRKKELSFHSDWGAVSDTNDACVYATREQAEEMRDLCGFYRIMKWPTHVEKSRLPVSVPGPGSPVSWEMPNSAAVRAPRAVKEKTAREKVTKIAKTKKAKTKPQQLSLFGD